VIPRLHVITDDEILTRKGFIPLAGEMMRIAGPALALHIRGPAAHGRFLFDRAEELNPLAREVGALFLVNDRLDVAMALELSGAHLAQRSLPASVARELLGPKKTLGVSVHDPEEAGSAGTAADYLVVGTLFPSVSHPGGPVGGARRIREIGEVSGLPRIGIGGITRPRVREVLEAGAHGVAVRGAVWDAPDPVGAVGVFLNELSSNPIIEDGMQGGVT